MKLAMRVTALEHGRDNLIVMDDDSASETFVDDKVLCLGF